MCQSPLNRFSQSVITEVQRAASGDRIGNIPAAVSPYDVIAAGFERQRRLPDRVAQSVRGAVLTAVANVDRPRILDVGAGTGRIGWPFVASGDDYVGADLSGGMLRVFATRPLDGKAAVIVRADGRALPFAAASFDAVLLISVFANVADARPLVDEARRVLRPRGALIIGRTAAPGVGIDERLKQHLDQLLDQRMPRARRRTGREEAASSLTAIASTTTAQIIASWTVARSPRGFLERHANGARFRQLPNAVREDVLHALACWAKTEFGTLDATFSETHRFEMQFFRFPRG